MTKNEIEKYLKEHIPYSLNIMLGHIRFINRYYPNPVNDSQILESVFVGSLAKGRMLLEAMGVKLNVAATDIQDTPSKNIRGKDVWADDLNGKLVDIQDLKTNRFIQYDFLKHYLIAANKYELHLTAQDVSRDLDKYNNAIPIIVDLVDQNFYLTTPDNRIMRTELVKTGVLPSDYFI
jgi:hypothetical protein